MVLLLAVWRELRCREREKADAERNV